MKLPKSIKLCVNKTNIRRGKKGDSQECAVSKAIARAICAKRRGLTVSVGGGNDITITKYLPHLYYRETVAEYTVSTGKGKDDMDNFINKFDDGPKRELKPRTFHLVQVSTQD